MSKRNDGAVFRCRVTDSIELVSNNPLTKDEKEEKSPELLDLRKRPLLVLCTWVGAKQAHINKYVDLYLRKGFDVLTVQTSYKKMLLPKTGYVATASDIVHFLEEHANFDPIVAHSMSAGMGAWCEAERILTGNERKYINIIHKIKGQIWDSVPAGPKAGPLSYLFFGKDGLIRRIGEMVIRTLLFFTYFYVNRYYINSTALLLDPPLKSPNLMLISKDDMIGRYEPNMNALGRWKSMGIKCQIKCWERSVHVSHLLFHPEEYEAEIDAFMKSIGIDYIKNK